MCRMREAIATTSLLSDMDMAKGLLGRRIVLETCVGLEGKWICRVQSQAAETRVDVEGQYSMHLTPASCELIDVCESDSKSSLRSMISVSF